MTTKQANTLRSLAVAMTGKSFDTPKTVVADADRVADACDDVTMEVVKALMRGASDEVDRVKRALVELDEKLGVLIASAKKARVLLTEIQETLDEEYKG